MSPATHPRSDVLGERLLVVDPESGAVADARIADLPAFLRAGDLLVVNDSATLPAMFGGVARGEAVEVRLVAALDGAVFRALLFGAGSWRQRTEDRPAPQRLEPGDVIAFEGGLSARVERVDPLAPRLVDVRFDRDGAPLWGALYRAGKAIQYSYLDSPLELWDVQTRYGSRPWSVEMPSAGRPLAWSVLLELRRRGVEVGFVTHAAGLSSSGDDAIDARFPLEERYEVPAETVRAVASAKRRGGRVIACGTTVARALEGAAAAHGGELVEGRGTTTLLLGQGHALRVVDGLFTGMHEPTASHYRLLEAFAPPSVVALAHEHANAMGYLSHEFGDSSLWLRSSRRSVEAPPS